MTDTTQDVLKASLNEKMVEVSALQEELATMEQAIRNADNQRKSIINRLFAAQSVRDYLKSMIKDDEETP